MIYLLHMIRTTNGEHQVPGWMVKLYHQNNSNDLVSSDEFFLLYKEEA